MRLACCGFGDATSSDLDVGGPHDLALCAPHG